MPVDQRDVDAVHTALFGWPEDPYSPPGLAALPSTHDVAWALIGSERFQGVLRDRVGMSPIDKWVCSDFHGAVGSFRIWLNLHDGFVSHGVLNNAWETNEVGFMLSLLGPGDAMLDIGANIGVFTVQAAAAVGPGGRVHAFEASPAIARMLQRTVFENGLAERCIVHACGLGDRAMAGRYHRSQHSTNPGASFISEDDADAGEPIAVCPLDDLRFDRRVSFVKMDVEGFEHRIVRGGGAFFREHRPTVLSEFFPRSLRVIGGLAGAAFIAEWQALGYATRLLEDGRPTRAITADTAAEFDAITEPVNIVCEPAT